MKFLLVFLSLLVSGGLFVSAVHAQTTAKGTLSISPAYIDISLTKAGETRSLPITFRNNSNEPLTIDVFPLDFTFADGNGTIGFLPSPGSYSYSLASYLSLEANQLTLDPKQTKIFTVIVTNRPDLRPGGHYAAIVGKVVSRRSSTFGAAVSPSLSSLIFLRKTGGERYNLSLNRTDQTQSVSFTYPESVNLQFQNEGNVHLVPYGTLMISDSFGRVIKRGVLNTSSFLVMPESQRNITVSLHQEKWSFPISFNMVTIRGNDSLHKTTYLYRNTFLYVNPLVIIIPLLGGVVFFGVKRRQKAKNIISERISDKRHNDKPKITRRGKKST